MKIVLINGSPKVNTSASAILLEDLKGCFAGRAEVIEAGLHTPTVSEDTLQIIGNADAWVFACPLYVDGIPAHLLSCLVQLDEAGLQHHGMHVYGIVNCGFYEGVQAEPALKLLQNWCVKTGAVWGGGIGVGGGGSLFMLPDGNETRSSPGFQGACGNRR
ncbi:MAG: hypothetical protein ACLSAP_10565 [Oscillospiraceae bacterium]